ncbi:MAG: type II secretion system protein GspJ [Pirellulaceae bacterium]|nr:type II secretion system protein GspJ [Pirellulaceae bacterium]
MRRYRKIRTVGVKRVVFGFTLVEVMLSLALCVVIMGLLAAASQMYLMNIQVERDELTRSRAARAVLQVMAFDLRAAVQFKPVDESALDESIAAVEEAMAALGGGETQTAPEPEEQQVVEQPGLAGGPNSISFDISRLPRRDQFAPVVDGKTGRVVSIPSEILNIQYMVGTVQEDNPSSNRNQAESGPRIGLLRMEFDRAAKRFADQGGGPVSGFEMMAEEVKGLAFRYFDGAQWSQQWDSNEMRTLPVAIEIILQVDPRTAEVMQQQARTGDIDAAFAMQEYRTVVHLPVAESLAAMQAREELKNYVE